MPRVDPEFRDLIAPLTADELAGLEASIRAEGCRDPLVIWAGQDILLDGHHRLAICEARGIPYNTTGLALEDRDAAREWVIRNQFARRNLTPYQRAELVLKLEPLIAAKAKENQRRAGGAVPQKSAEAVETRAELARRAGVSHDTIAKAKVIAERAPEAVKEALRLGETTINAAHLDVLRAERTSKVRALHVMETAPAPNRKYACLVVDPPWPMKRSMVDARGVDSRVLDYPTMTLDEIAAFDIPRESAATNAHLYLWTTHKHLPRAIEIAKAWGFEYHCLLTWIKTYGFTPFSFSFTTEHVIFARRGNLDVVRKGLHLEFYGKRREHSRKPEEFYELVRTASPGPRLDVFGRESREGFDVWGNETDRFSASAG